MGSDFSENTVMFKVRPEDVNQARDILMQVYIALEKKGYNPINQLVGYLLSGDPAYITSYGNARSLIRRLERDELLEELVRHYLNESTIAAYNNPPVPAKE
ncbi:MAG: IreB family regulatory phosphoprotein [Desulfotomaculum sp.]|nr:IreB family regulatory phosphoprotein [Desulfotomaculum sp.]